ncbi:hypothetical protein CW304_29245 [Bacillus sp. UFRGS-B20]|nr:hypothetical protein CW304_29245 [Bacillus sp. UFRGS-B20]
MDFKTSIESLTKKDTVSNNYIQLNLTVEGKRRLFLMWQQTTSGLKHKTKTEMKEEAGKSVRS